LGLLEFFMSEYAYFCLEWEYAWTHDVLLYPLIRKERDRRRNLFMHSAPRSKAWWDWHNALCDKFKKFYENQNALPDGQETKDCLRKEKRVDHHELS